MIGPISEGVRGEDKVHGSGSGGEHLLPFRNFHVGGGATDHGDNQRGMGKTLALEFDMFGLSVRIFGAECGCNRRTGREPRIAFEHDKTPGRELAMVRHAAGDGQELVDFRGGGSGGRQGDRFAGTSRGKEFNGVGHGVPNKERSRFAKERTFVNPPRCLWMQELPQNPKQHLQR